MNLYKTVFIVIIVRMLFRNNTLLDVIRAVARNRQKLNHVRTMCAMANRLARNGFSMQNTFAIFFLILSLWSFSQGKQNKVTRWNHIEIARLGD